MAEGLAGPGRLPTAGAAAASAVAAVVAPPGPRRRDHLRAPRQRQAVLLRGDPAGHQVHARVPGDHWRTL